MKVALIHPTGHFFNTPCVPNIARILADHEFEVTVYTVSNSAAASGYIPGDRVKFVYLPWTQSEAKENVVLLSLQFLLWLPFQIAKRRERFLLASGIRALFVVGALSFVLPFRFAYYSLELYSGRKFDTAVGRVFKWLERKFNRRAVFSVVQDDRRAQILRRINQLNDGPILTFANAPLKVPSRVGMEIGEEDKERSLALRRRMNIRSHNRIVLYAGSFSDPWACVGRIAHIARKLPEGWTLVLQARMSEESWAEEHLANIASVGKLLWSGQPLSVDDYEGLVKISDIGLAWYESDDENIRYVGLSSGKIAQYWAYGKPIIIRRIPLYTELCSKYNAGVVVDAVQEIPGAICTIASRYPMYVAGARRAFDTVFDVRKEGERIADAIRGKLCS